MPETADDESGGESDVEGLERHYRVTLDFRLRLRPLTSEVCRESPFFKEENAAAEELDLRESVERQRRLLALLWKNERVLERYLLTVVAHEAVSFVLSGLTGAPTIKIPSEYEEASFHCRGEVCCLALSRAEMGKRIGSAEKVMLGL